LQTFFSPEPLDYFPSKDHHFTRIRSWLQLQRVEATGISLVPSLAYGSMTKSMAGAMLPIWTKADSGNMFMAVRDIRKSLARHGIHIAIEIIDERAITSGHS
jgi:hypothetical protein